MFYLLANQQKTTSASSGLASGSSSADGSGAPASMFAGQGPIGRSMSIQAPSAFTSSDVNTPQPGSGGEHVQTKYSDFCHRCYVKGIPRNSSHVTYKCKWRIQSNLAHLVNLQSFFSVCDMFGVTWVKFYKFTSREKVWYQYSYDKYTFEIHDNTFVYKYIDTSMCMYGA